MIAPMIRTGLALAAILCVAACASTPTQTVKRFNQGYLAGREPALTRLLEATRQPSTTEYGQVREAVGSLYGAYNRRAERQQAFLDAGSALTFIGAAGAFEGGLSNSTRTAWAVAAFTPTIITQFNAYEPTRELFHGGALALQLITVRYDNILRAGDIAAIDPIRANCTPYQDLISRVAGWQTKDTSRQWDRGNAVRIEAERLLGACRNLETRLAALGATSTYADALEPWIAASYASDVVRLDHAIVGQDRQLRYTPAETLGALVSGPFRAADMLLTGSNTKAALDAISTLNAFNGLNQALADVSFPPLPPEAVVPQAMSPALAERMTSADTAVDVISVLRALEAEHAVLVQQEAAYAFRLDAARRVFQAVRADRLTFTYDVGTRTTIVSLGPAPAPSTATSSTSQAAPPQL